MGQVVGAFKARPEVEDFDGGKVNIKEFEEDFKEEAAYVKSSVVAGMKPIADEMTSMRDEIVALRYWQDVSDAHPGARQIAKSKEFNDWLGKQPEPIQKAANVLDSGDAISILNAYKKHVAKTATPAAKPSGKKVAIHSSTLRGSTAPMSSGKSRAYASEAEEYDAAAKEAGL